jgi:TolA-binding protein
MSGRWQPDDAELDALAGSLEPFEPTADRLERGRLSIVDASRTTPQLGPRPRVGVLVAIPIAAAAAAIITLYLSGGGERTVLARAIEGVAIDKVATDAAPEIASVPADGSVAEPEARDAAPTSAARVAVQPRGAVDFDDGASAGGERIVTLRSGELLVEVANLATTQRFRLRAGDAEIEAFQARFSALAVDSRLEAIVVYEGRIELRAGKRTRTLEAGDRWSPQRPAKSSDNAPSPGEAELRSGWAALRATEYDKAADALDTACKLASAAIAQDACFWSGVAAKRANDPARARRLLARFLRRFPKSSRSGEAAALLGWLLYDAGDLGGAEARFRAAAGDRVPKVSRSARSGLEAIAKRRRARPRKAP